VVIDVKPVPVPLVKLIVSTPATAKVAIATAVLVLLVVIDTVSNWPTLDAFLTPMFSAPETIVVIAAAWVAVTFVNVALPLVRKAVIPPIRSISRPNAPVDCTTSKFVYLEPEAVVNWFAFVNTIRSAVPAPALTAAPTPKMAPAVTMSLPVPPVNTIAVDVPNVVVTAPVAVAASTVTVALFKTPVLTAPVLLMVSFVAATALTLVVTAPAPAIVKVVPTTPAAVNAPVVKLVVALIANVVAEAGAVTAPTVFAAPVELIVELRTPVPVTTIAPPVLPPLIFNVDDVAVVP